MFEVTEVARECNNEVLRIQYAAVGTIELLRACFDSLDYWRGAFHKSLWNLCRLAARSPPAATFCAIRGSPKLQAKISMIPRMPPA